MLLIKSLLIIAGIVEVAWGIYFTSFGCRAQFIWAYWSLVSIWCWYQYYIASKYMKLIYFSYTTHNMQTIFYIHALWILALENPITLCLSKWWDWSCRMFNETWSTNGNATRRKWRMRVKFCYWCKSGNDIFIFLYFYMTLVWLYTTSSCMSTW